MEKALTCFVGILVLILFILALLHPFFANKGNLDTFIVMVSLLGLSVNNLIDAYPSLEKIRAFLLKWGIVVIGVGLLMAGGGAWYFDKSKINLSFLVCCGIFALLVTLLLWLEWRRVNGNSIINFEQKRKSLIYAYYWLSLLLIYVQYIDFKELYK